MNKFNKLKKDELINVLNKHIDLNQQLAILVIESLISLSKTSEYENFLEQHRDRINNLNNILNNNLKLNQNDNLK